MKPLVLLSTVFLAVAVTTTPVAAQSSSTRIEGADRVETAVRVSEQFWPDGAASVVLARADDFPDALAGGPLADIAGAPILLTGSTELDDRVLAEITRLGAANVYLLGGARALSSAVEEALPDGLNVRRFGGRDRYETAEIIDAAVSASTELPDAAVVASGEDYPDALMAADLVPPRVLLSRQDRFDSYNPAYSYTIVGGTTVISEEVARQTGGVRLAGVDRYDTAAAVLEASTATRGPGPLFVATGSDAADALAGGAVVARTQGYLLIVDPLLGPTPAQREVLATNADKFPEVWALGGTAALPEAAVDAVVGAIDPSSGGLDVDCSDFEFQEEAQETYDDASTPADPDPYELDADNDGIACEELPSIAGPDDATLTQLTPVECTVELGGGVVTCPAHTMAAGELAVTYTASDGVDAITTVWENVCDDPEGDLLVASEESNDPVAIELEPGEYCVITTLLDIGGEPRTDTLLLTDVTVT